MLKFVYRVNVIFSVLEIDYLLFLVKCRIKNCWYCLTAEAEAEVLRKKKCVEFQQMEENKLSLAQINGRLTALKDRRDELEEEKRALLNQVQTADDAMAASLVVPKSEFNWY